MDGFFLFFGLGATIGIIYTTIRYGVPVLLGFAGCVLELGRQVVVGFAQGVREGLGKQR